jgi:hypothetical protein
MLPSINVVKGLILSVLGIVTTQKPLVPLIPEDVKEICSFFGLTEKLEIVELLKAVIVNGILSITH